MYLIDRYFFSPEEMEENSLVLTWPDRINPIFDDNENMMEAEKSKGEMNLINTRNNVIAGRGITSLVNSLYTPIGPLLDDRLKEKFLKR